MKQTNGALTLLLKAYRSVFKAAYIKGLASAVVLTAGLSAGASNATMFISSEINDPTSWTPSPDIDSANWAAGKVSTGLESGSKVSLGNLTFGPKGTTGVNIIQAESGAIGGYIYFADGASTVTADTNTLTLNASGVINANAVGGWAKTKGTGIAIAQGNTLKVDGTSTNTTATILGQAIGGFASSLNGAIANNNTVSIKGASGEGVDKLSTGSGDNIYGGMAGIESGASVGVYSATNNTVALENYTFGTRKASVNGQIVGGTISVWGNASADKFESSNNTVSLKNVTIDHDNALVAANLVNVKSKDASSADITADVDQIVANGSEGTGLLIENSTFNNTNLAGAWVVTSGSFTANNNRVALSGSNTLNSGSNIIGVNGSTTVTSNNTPVTINVNNTSIATQKNDNDVVTITSGGNVIGALIETTSGDASVTDYSKVTINANGNSVLVGNKTTISNAVDKNNGYVLGVSINTDVKNGKITANNNNVEFNGTITGNQKGGQGASGWVGAVVNAGHGFVNAQNNTVTVNGKVTDGQIFAVMNGSAEEDNSTPSSFDHNLNGNTVIIGKDATVTNSTIYAAYSEKEASVLNEKVTVSGTVKNSNIYGGMGAGSVVTLDSTSKYSVDTGTFTIDSDVVNLAGEMRIDGNLTVEGYGSEGKHGNGYKNPNNTTIESTAKIYLGSDLILNGHTDVVDGATLYATNNSAKIIISGDNAIDNKKDKDNDIFGDFVNDSKESVLSISTTTLNNYFKGGLDYPLVTDPVTNGKTAQGIVEITKQGVLNFKDDSVVLSDYNFTTGTDAGSFKVDDDWSDTEGSVSGSIFRGNEITIAHALATNSTTVKEDADLTVDDLDSVDADGIQVEANVLNLGASDLTSAQSKDILFHKAIAKNEINFSALTSGKDVAGNDNYGFHLNAEVEGNNFETVKDQSGKVIYYLAQDGVVNGDVTIGSDGTNSGLLSITAGNWTANGDITVASGGTLSVTSSTAPNPELTEVQNPDATLVTSNVVLDVSKGGPATISVTGSNDSYYDVEEASQTAGDDGLAVLDLRNGLSMKGEVTGTGPSAITTFNGKAEITATNGGVIKLAGDDVTAMLAQNRADNVTGAAQAGDGSGAFFSASNHGVLYVEGELTTDFADFDTTKHGINLSNNGALVADTLNVYNTDVTTSAIEDTAANFNKVSFGGSVYVNDLDVSDLQTTSGSSKPAGANSYASQVTIANGNVHVANSLSSNNYTLILGETGETVGANVYLSTDLATESGSVNVANLRVDKGSLRVENGDWDASSTTINLNSANATLTVGGEFDEDANDVRFAPNLTANRLVMAQGSKLNVEADGSATFTTADFSKLASSTTASGANVVIAGELTITGDAAYTVEGVEDAKSGVAFGGDGSIFIDKNGFLTFGEAATTGAIIANGSYATAESVTSAMDEDYSLIRNNGGMLTLGLNNSTVFDDEAILQLKKELFTADSYDATSTELVNGGILNIGGAKFTGVEVKPLSCDGLSGYTADWDDLKSFSDIYGTDVTNAALLQTNVSNIAVGDAVRGHWGSLTMATDAASSAQVIIDGHTTLNYAEGNRGYFISNASRDAALGANVQQSNTLSLIGGGSIGKISLQAGQNNVEKNETTLNVEGDGLTKIASIEGVGGTGIAPDTSVNILGDTEVTGDINNIDNLYVQGASLTANKINTYDVTAEFGATVKAKEITSEEGFVFGGTVTAEDYTFTGTDNDNSIDVLGGGTLTVTDTLRFDKAGIINVGYDFTQEEYDALVSELEEEGLSGVDVNGTGYLEAAIVDLNAGTLVVDPDYSEKTSIAAIGKFQNNKETYAYDNDKGTLNGALLIGKNAVAGIGATLAETKDAIAQYQNANGSLSEDEYGSILYLNGQINVAQGGEIALNSDSKVVDRNGIRDTLKYTVTENTLDQEADLGLGKNTAILMTENAFENADGEKLGTAISFDRTDAVVNGEGGEIVLVGTFDTSEKLNFFADKGNATDSTMTGVKVVGQDIYVYTQNGFLYGVIPVGENEGQDVQMQVDKERAQNVMYEASDPVLDTLIAYGNRGLAPQAPTEPTTPDEPQEPQQQPDNVIGNNGALVGVADPTQEQEIVEPEKIEQPQPQSEQNTQTAQAKVSSSFLDEVITTSHGAPAETAARMAVYGGAVEAVMLASSTSTDAIASRMGMANKDSVLTYANNADGAGIWLAPVYKNHESDGFDAQGVDYGADIDLTGVALGVDYTFAQNFRAGAMFNVGSGDADGQGAGSAVSNDFDYWGVSVYGGFTYDKLSVTADLGYTVVDNDLDASTGMADYGKLTASTDTESLTLGVTAQYKFEFDALDVAPHIGARFTRIDMDDYSVKSNGETVSEFSADSMNVFSIPVGVTFSKDMQAGDWRVMPSLDLTVTANTGDDEFDGDVSWNGTNLTTATSTEVLDSFTYGAALGISAQYNNFSFGIGVNYVGSDNTDEYGVQANARFTF